MRISKVIAMMIVLALATTSFLPVLPAEAKPAKPAKVKNYKAGEVVCPAGLLVFGNIVIQSGRCLLLFVLRGDRGTFLAFAAPDSKIPPGPLVRRRAAPGARLKGRMFYL